MGGDDSMDVLGRIRELLDEQGITPYELSKRSDVAESTVSNMLNRGSLPSITTLEQLCGGLGITLSQFFATDGESITLTAEQKRTIKAMSKFNPSTRETLLDFMEKLPRDLQN